MELEKGMPPKNNGWNPQIDELFSKRSIDETCSALAEGSLRIGLTTLDGWNPAPPGIYETL